MTAAEEFAIAISDYTLRLEGAHWCADTSAGTVPRDITLWTWGPDPEDAMQDACDEILPDGGRGWLITLAPLTDAFGCCVWTITPPT